MATHGSDLQGRAPRAGQQTAGTAAAAGARRASRRLAGVDAARGTALLGMMSVHVIPEAAEDGGTTTAHLLAAGRSAALFAVLAGVGIALASGGREPVRGRRRLRFSLALVLRGLAVGAVGLLLAELETGVAVILAYYAVLFLLAVPLLGMRPTLLLALAAAAAVVVPVLSQAVRPELDEPIRSSPTFATLADDPVGLLQTVALTGYYPVLAWTAYLCAGLAVGRLALHDRRVATALLAGGAALALVASAVSALLLGPLGGYGQIAAETDLRGQTVEDVVAEGRFGSVPTTTWWWLSTDAPHSTTPPDLLHTTGTALAVLGGMLLVAGALRGRRSWLLAPLAAVGSMPLSLYSLHLGVLAVVEAGEPVRFWAAQAAGALVLATLWRRFIGRGPLEALLAALTRAVTAGT